MRKLELELENLITKLKAGENNTFVSQYRVLKILLEDSKNEMPGLTKVEIVRKFLSKYHETSYPDDKDLRKEARNNKYKQWLSALLSEHLITCLNDKPPYVYTIAQPDGNHFNHLIIKEEEGNNLSESEHILQLWLAVNMELNFLPLSEDVKEVFSRSFHYFKELNPIDWIKTTSLTKNTASEELRNKLTCIYNCFFEESKLSFLYKEEEKVNNLIPCLLKEHKGMWYVIGSFKAAEEEELRSFSIHRMESIKQAEELSPNEVEFQLKGREKSTTIYNNSLGGFSSWHNSIVKKQEDDQVSRHHDEPLQISFKVKDGKKFDNISYLVINPIHRTQDGPFEKSIDGFATFKLTCFPDADLVREIRKLGNENVKEITCDWLQQSDEELPNLEKWVWDL